MVHVADWFAVFVEVATGRAAGFLENVGDLKAVDNPDAGVQRLPAPDAVNVWAGDITYTRARALSLSLSLSLSPEYVRGHLSTDGRVAPC